MPPFRGLFIVLLVGRDATGKKEEAAMEVKQGKVSAGDIDIAYTAVGSGTPLIVLHGGPGIGPGYLRRLDA